MRLLFVCARNRLRSPTAERLFDGVCGVETLSAGVSPDAEQPVTAELVEWADVLLVMEPSHRTKLSQAFGRRLRDKRVVCLGIADNYGYMDHELVRILWERVPRSVPLLSRGRPDSMNCASDRPDLDGDSAIIPFGSP
jgi:predicted protein tyrosine phosphatase